MAETGAVVAAEALSSSYRLKFARSEFLDLVRTAQPKRIYKFKNTHFFSFDGFVMYSSECQDLDFGIRIFNAIEFSNQAWQKA